MYWKHTRQCYAQSQCDNIGSEFKLPTSSGQAHTPSPECTETEPTQMPKEGLKKSECLKKVLENCPPCLAA